MQYQFDFHKSYRRGLILLLRSIIVVLVIAIVFDRLVLPGIQNFVKPGWSSWVTEDIKINRLMAQRNRATPQDPVWHSALLPDPANLPRRKRILVIGDSYVWGHGCINVNDLWWRQLERELHRRGYEDVTVIGAGWNGASTRIELSWIPQLMEKYKPDMVVWGYVPNDPDESENEKTAIERGTDLRGNDMQRTLTDMFPHLYPYFMSIRYVASLNKGVGISSSSTYGDWLSALVHGKNFVEFQKTVQEWSKRTKSLPAPCVVMFLPMPFEKVYADSFAPVKQLLQQNGMPFVDMLGQLMAWYRALPTEKQDLQKLQINPGNGHPGSMINHFYAVETANLLEAKYPQALGTKTPMNTVFSRHIIINDVVPESISLKTVDTDTYMLLYPTKENALLSEEMKRPYIQLNLSDAATIQAISISGKNLQSATVMVGCIDEKRGADAGERHILDPRLGSEETWSFATTTDWTRRIDRIMISAKFDGPDRTLKLHLPRVEGLPRQ